MVRHCHTDAKSHREQIIATHFLTTWELLTKILSNRGVDFPLLLRLADVQNTTFFITC